MTWFETLTGVSELSGDQVREQLYVQDGVLISRANGRKWNCGTLEIVSLGELQERVEMLRASDQQTEKNASPTRGRRLRVRIEIANVRDLHYDPDNANALFQVASQFNLLEMMHPAVTPEQGIGIYEHDRTQGPVCAMAAGAGTVYRQYFVQVEPNAPPGQTAHRQIDCLDGLGATLGDIAGQPGKRFWTMKNGYALPNLRQLTDLDRVLQQATEAERRRLCESLRVGIQWQTQVTPATQRVDSTKQFHCVSQVYCSALPVSYADNVPKDKLQLWACLVLQAAYEATLAAAVLNQSFSSKVYVTLLGGGAFGNDVTWICDALHHALTKYQQWDLDVVLVSYSSNVQLEVLELIRRWSSTSSSE